MKHLIAIMAALIIVLGATACVAGARYKGAARSAAPAATAPDPFGRTINRGVPVFTDHAGDTKPGQQ